MRNEVDVLWEGTDDESAELTVVISLYDYAEFIAATLDSVKAQTLKALDLVVVDDCSTDDSAGVAREWLEVNGSRFGRSLLLRNDENQGLGTTRNNAFWFARTEFVFVLDADNLLYPRCLERLLAALRNSGAAFAYCYLEKFGGVQELGNLLSWDARLLHLGNMTDAMVLHRKKTWKEAGGYSEDMPVNGWEDYDLWFKIANVGGSGVRVPEILARYRVHPDSMLHRETDVPADKDRLWKYLESKHPQFFGTAFSEADYRYQKWITDSEPGVTDLIRQRETRFEKAPLISLLVPVYDTPKRFLLEMLDSVERQTYSNWELCLVDGASRKGHVREILESRATRDSRIQVKTLDRNLGIAGNSNVALGMASGQYIGLLDHDDRLAPSALFEVAKSLEQNPDADLLYSDEDYLWPAELRGASTHRRGSPHFKPEWSPDLLRSTNYITHFCVASRSAVEAVGGFREGFDGSQDYDLVLRVAEEARRIVHIPKVLYHWRIHGLSTAANPEAKEYAWENGRRALEEHLARTGRSGRVEEVEGLPGCYRAIHALPSRPLLSVVVLDCGDAKQLKRCLRSIERSGWGPVEVFVADPVCGAARRHGSSQRSAKDESPSALGSEKLPALFNAAARAASGELLLFLHSSVEASSAGWLESLAEHALRKEVGGVGAKLSSPDRAIEEAGLIIGCGPLPVRKAFRGSNSDAEGYARRLQIVRNCSAVSAACLMTRRELFFEVGGFAECYDDSFHDVDYCLRLREREYLVVWTPHAELSRRPGAQTPQPSKRDLRTFAERWKEVLREVDPYYSAHLTDRKEDFSIDHLGRRRMPREGKSTTHGQSHGLESE
jgi:glycosyltransferase involved in cell wall biosynthesis